MVMKASAFLAYVTSVILGFLGVLYLLASVYAPQRLITGSLLLGSAILIIALTVWKTSIPKKIIVQWSPSGELEVEELKCPYCGAPITELKPGMDIIKCKYCGKTIKVEEKPIW